jgi:L-ascorbate metabolism protein UlaG (beta-lactamase superfamily)
MIIKRITFLKMVGITIITLFLASFGLLQLPQFGRKASGGRRQRILKSPNFKDGKFQNLSYTPDLSPNYSYWDIFLQSLKKYKDKYPLAPLPFVKTNLHDIDAAKNGIVWFGHSSYLLFFEGKKILVDPVFSGYAAPFSFAMNAFKGTNNFSPADMPVIDILVITHDHYDHLDYQTIKKLKPKIKHIITSLGVGEHLEHWGIAPEKITELDWHESHQIADLEFISAPTRHFSGRSFSPKTTLWGSFVLKGQYSKIYLGGDSGYDSHFTTIGQKHGPFDLAILDGAQYNDAWRDIHMTPEQSVQAAIDLKAKKLLPVHWAKFALAHHAWYEPIERLTKECNAQNLSYFTPKIGENSNWQTINTVV